MCPASNHGTESASSSDMGLPVVKRLRNEIASTLCRKDRAMRLAFGVDAIGFSRDKPKEKPMHVTGSGWVARVRANRNGEAKYLPKLV